MKHSIEERLFTVCCLTDLYAEGVEGMEDEGFHDEVAGDGGVNVIVTQTGLESAVIGCHLRPIIDIRDVMGFGIGTNQCIHLLYAYRCIGYAIRPIEPACRQ